MDNKPTRPQKVAKQPLPPVSKPETVPETKYARRTLIGSELSGKKVTKVGLGNLEVITTYDKHADV